MNQLAPIESLAIKEPAKPTTKQKKALSEAKAFEKFGIHALRVKTKVLAALGKEAETAGIKHLGHGKVIVASENAETAIGTIARLVDKLSLGDKPDIELIIELLRLQREFNSQLIMTAQVHLRVSNLAGDDGAQPPGANLTVPFPANAPIMIAVGKAQSPSS